MRFLRTQDYYKQIQPQNLYEIIEGDETLLLYTEQAAQAEMTGYLAQRYDVAKVFTNTSTFDIAATYTANNLVELTAPTYSTTSTYNANNLVVYSGSVYSSVSGSTGVLPSTGTTDWNYLAKDHSLFYVTQPAQSYKANTTYAAGSVVFYNDVIYTALTQTTNVMPDSNTSIWVGGLPYSVTGILPTNTAVFTAGDNRNAIILMFMLDIVLYHLSSRLNPQNVPQLRSVRYDNAGANQKGGAIGWLKMVADGNINAGLPEIIATPVSNGNGISIQWGSNPSNINYY